MTSGGMVVEYGLRMADGSMQVRPNDPETEDAYPLAKWLFHQQRFGIMVRTRTIIVVEDWHEVDR